ncbi:MAG: DegT/DnrJ/EryC1/StrS family aminotransferase [Gemmatimonadetes bacterium]|nr:DegT/DnrJ/EryC1/StrS family aminotransferase [Gemmatimonadota bacterium]
MDLPGGDRYLVFGAPTIGDEEIAEVVDSLRSGWIGTGPKVARFEELLREYTGAEHAVAVHSCTAALHLSMVAAGLGPGDEVITTPMTFVATVNAIVHVGATPVLVDCDRDTQLVTPERIEAAVTPRTRAVIPVHLAGRICDLEAIHDIARRHGLLVIEDAAHALEGAYRGRKVGTVSQLTCFSFYVTKNLTTGEGGLVTTSDPDLAGRIRTYALHGLSRDAWKRFSDAGYRHYQVHYPGFKYNMMDLQAAIGIHQVPHLAEWLARRERIWARYDEAFADLPVGTPAPAGPDTVHARHLYTLMVDEARCGVSRDEFMARLHERGIGTGVHYQGVHLHPYYRDAFGWRPEDFPNTTWIGERTLSLPLSGALGDDDVERVVDAVRASLPRGGA